MSGKRLSAFSASGYLLIGRFDASLRWLDASHGLQALLRRSIKSLRGASLLDIVHPGDIAQVDRAFQQARSEGVSKPIVFRILPSNGGAAPPSRDRLNDTDELPLARGVRPRHVRMEVRARESGAAAFFDVHLVDVSSLARAELKLRKRSLELTLANERLQQSNQDLERLKESYRDLYHNAPVMFFSLDEQGRLVTFNDTLLRRLGYEREELLKAPYATLLAPEAAAEWTQGRRGAHSLTRDREVETQWRTRDGSLLDVWVRSVAIVDEEGRFVRSRSAAVDLTERNRLANELRARSGELEKTNARLLQINAELEDFTHVVSHDLKEPLRTIESLGNLMALEYSAQLGPDGFEYINHLINASRRLGNLIDDLLQLGQVGRVAGTPQTFDLIEAVAVARRDLIDLIQRKQALVLTEGSLPRVAGDQKRITQLIANLVANGLKYNQNPAPQVVIGAANGVTPPAGKNVDPSHAVLYVRDNGIGIDPRYHQQIFGIFRRLHGEEFEGTGAGLAICKKIVEAHGGRIWVESVPEAGATFYFTLPRSPVELDGHRPSSDNVANLPRVVPREDVPPPRATERPAPQTIDESTPRLLLVEDMEDVAVIIRRISARSRLSVVWFSNAEDAWEHLQTHEPDLMLLDVNLPGMSGIDLCRKIRTELGRNEAPIVLFTQDHTPEVEERMRQAGGTCLLSKELLSKPSVWERRIRELLRAPAEG